jgi:Holliday junction resolvasome RuvABC endonuclease subunit
MDASDRHRLNADLADRTIALGIDPGTRRLGWAVVSWGPLCGYGPIDDGVLTLSGPMGDRLRAVRELIASLIETRKPHEVALERMFHHPKRGAHATLALGKVTGVIQEVCASLDAYQGQYPGREGTPVVQMAPMEWRRAVTGSGASSHAETDRITRLQIASAASPLRPRGGLDHERVDARGIALAGLWRVCGTVSQAEIAAAKRGNPRHHARAAPP